MRPTAAVIVMPEGPDVVAPVWSGPVYCRYCRTHRRMATVMVAEYGEVFMSLRVPWLNPETGEKITSTEFAPISVYTETNPEFAWVHHCGREDGAADLATLAAEAVDSRHQRRQFLVG